MMRVIYHGWSGGHAAPVAAAIHLDLLSMWCFPGKDEIAALPYFDGLGRHDRGFLHFCGRDEQGREVYIMGRGSAAALAERAAKAAAGLTNQDPEELVFVDCTRAVGACWFIYGMLAGFFSGRAGRRRFLAGVIARQYAHLVDLVRPFKGLAS